MRCSRLSRRLTKEDGMLSLSQARTFRALMRTRMSQLCDMGVVGSATGDSAPLFVNLLLRPLLSRGFLHRHGIDRRPLGFGDTSWAGFEAQLCSRHLGITDPWEQRSICLAIASSLRAALLETRAHDGGTCRSVREVVAYARHVGPYAELRPIDRDVLATEPGDQEGSRWKRVQQALACGALSAGDFIALRDIRTSYESFVACDRFLLLPWAVSDCEKRAVEALERSPKVVAERAA